MIPGAKPSFQAAQEKGICAGSQAAPGLCQLLAPPQLQPLNPTAQNYSFLIFSPSNPAPNPLIPPAQLFPAASRRAAPGAAPLLPLAMAILLFLFQMELCYWASLFLCFIDCKVQHCSFEMLRAGSAPAPERIRNVAWVDLIVSSLLPKSSGMPRTSLGGICCSHRVRDAPGASPWAWTAPSSTKQTPNSPAHILWSVLGTELDQECINRFIFFSAFMKFWFIPTLVSSHQWQSQQALRGNFSLGRRKSGGKMLLEDRYLYKWQNIYYQYL